MMEKIVNLIWHGAMMIGLMMLLLLIAFGLTGCASSDSYKAYLNAHAASVKSQKPMLRITSQPGQPITGLASIEVYGPGATPQQEKDSEWARVVSSGLQVVGVVGGIVAAGQASQDLVNAVGHHLQPGAVSTTTIDNSITDTHAISNSYNATATPTVVTQPAPVIVTQPPPLVVQPQVVLP